MQDSIDILETEAVDLNKVAALQQKRTLAFVNHFTITTVQFINNFSKQCEHKLMHFERKLEKISAMMVLLEARLSSIPEVNSFTESTKPQEINNMPDSKDNKELEDLAERDIDISNQSFESQETNAKYQKFIKMVLVGVPLDAVKLKLSIEGLDPKVLDQLLAK